MLHTSSAFSSEQARDIVLFFKQPKSYQFVEVPYLGPLIEGRKIVILFPDEGGASVVVVGPSNEKHFQIYASIQGTKHDPMLAYTWFPFNRPPVCEPGGGSISKLLAEVSLAQFEWFKTTSVHKEINTSFQSADRSS